jgi:isoleucyl-tRNA synthetase
MKVTKPPKTIHFPSVEKDVRQFWENSHIPECLAEERKGNPVYTYLDGPPFATGLPHFGHFIPNSIKDAFARYFSMKGYRVDRRFGWDCHGVPVEMLVQKELGLKTTKDIEEYGIDAFNNACRTSVLKFTSEWMEYFQRLGRWVDPKKQYRTMDLSFMESVWALFKKLFDKGLIYEGKFVVSYSAALGTTLSNFEAGLDYRDVQDPSLTVAFKLQNQSQAYVLVWTTTPWTLPANVAVVVHPDLIYSEVLDLKTQNTYYLLSDHLTTYFKDESSYEVKRTLKGQELVGLRYEPLFSEHVSKLNDKAFHIYPATYVLSDTGTGFVHTSPAFGEDDFQTSKRFGLDVLDHLDGNGHFLKDNKEDLCGLFFKDADKLIIAHLKKQGLVFKQDTLVHAYPYCYRSGTPLFFRAVPSWFLKIEDSRSLLLEVNRQIHWVPHHIQQGRFGRWLENAKDWNIARSRYWGNPLPLWKNEETGEMVCLGSIDELQAYSDKPITDLHIDTVDSITIPSQKDSTQVLKRVPFVLDCWFESGSAPYAQLHYPFENEELFKESFPVDFISEGLDQTRGWFYTLTILSSLLYEKPAFKNVIVNGLALAEDGKKMSKSLRNFPDPMETIDECGADAVRLFLLSSPAAHGDEVRFSLEGVKETVRRYLLPVWNAYTFFATYASLDEWDPEETRVQEKSHSLDQWILLYKKDLLKKLEKAMSTYEISTFFPSLLEFLDSLNNWYIRRSRRRFWNSDKEAYATLYEILVDLSKVLAPFAPFFADFLYQKLALTKEAKKSVHLATFSKEELNSNFTKEEQTLLREMQIARDIVELGRTIRVTHKIKNRQPLKSLTVGIFEKSKAQDVKKMKEVICQELNVKELIISEKPFEMADVFIKPNFKSLGKRLGANIKSFQKYLEMLSKADKLQIVQGQPLHFNDEVIPSDDLIIELRSSDEHELVATHIHYVVSLNAQLSEDLILEGHARELVSSIQRLRKQAGFEVEDRVTLYVDALEAVQFSKALESNRTYIEEETLSSFLNAKPETYKVKEDLQINDHVVSVYIGLGSA